MKAPLQLSVLDLSPVPSGSSASVALRNTLDLARHADELGYVRYWLAIWLLGSSDFSARLAAQ